MTDTDEILARLDAIEERVYKLERARGAYDRLPLDSPPPIYPRGCVCPLGVEQVCREPLCPRKGWEITGGSGANL